jgi:hypothetical protein
MTLPIRTLPIVEHWDCHSCGFYGRGTKFKLSDEDLKRVRGQEWEKPTIVANERNVFVIPRLRFGLM